MAATDAEERGQLIPGLSEELVLAHVVPRLPWYTRLLCRALSQSWRAALDTRNPVLDLRTRPLQLPALRGLFLFCTFDNHIFIRDTDVHDPWHTKAYKIQPHWRRLPSLDGLVVRLPTRANIVASSGMVCVWLYAGSLKFVLKLDVGCAEWTWKKFPVSHPFDFDTISFNDRIYAPLILPRSLRKSRRRKYGIFVYDMMTDKCRLVETRKEMHVRVVLECRQSNLCIEEMYCFVGHELDPMVGVLRYDIESDSWSNHEKVPVPPMRFRYRFHIELLSSDCFEPAPKRGINIIWVNHEYNSFFWFNSSVGKVWVEISYNPILEGRHLLHLLPIRGSMYGIFTNKQEDTENAREEEDGGGSLIFSKETVLMKGRVVVASKSVAWEDVHKVGLFHKIQLSDCCTFMA